MNEYWDRILEFCIQTTTIIGDRLMQDFGNIQADEKEDGSLVTQADKWSDREIREAIALSFPEHGVLTEETEHIFPDNDWCWVVDPIDGTTNFTRGVPLWAISLGLLYKGTPVFGFVYIPPTKQIFHGFWYGESGLTGLRERISTTSQYIPVASILAVHNYLIFALVVKLFLESLFLVRSECSVLPATT